MTTRPYNLTLARSLQKRAARLKSVGYSHPPIIDINDVAYFNCATPDGRKYRVRVEEVDEFDILVQVRDAVRQLREYVDKKRYIKIESVVFELTLRGLLVRDSYERLMDLNQESVRELMYNRREYDRHAYNELADMRHRAKLLNTIKVLNEFHGTSF